MDKNPGALSVLPNVSVDCVIFGFDDEHRLNVLLIQRKQENKQVLALPGDLVFINEDLDDAAKRVLKALTRLENIYLQQFHTFGSLDRLSKDEDKQWLESFRQVPDARVVSVGYFSLVNLRDYSPVPDYFASEVKWYCLEDVPELAFDHNEIINRALLALRLKLNTSFIVFELLPEKFTLSELQGVYETILNEELDKRNFRKKFLSRDVLIPLDEKQRGVAHKPAQLFSFDSKRKHDPIIF